jgi:hypothetical protein
MRAALKRLCRRGKTRRVANSVEPGHIRGMCARFLRAAGLVLAALTILAGPLAPRVPAVAHVAAMPCHDQPAAPAHACPMVACCAALPETPAPVAVPLPRTVPLPPRLIERAALPPGLHPTPEPPPPRPV